MRGELRGARLAFLRAAAAEYWILSTAIIPQGCRAFSSRRGLRCLRAAPPPPHNPRVGTDHPVIPHNNRLESPAALIARHLRLASTSWSMGVPGAIAEFFRAEGEPFESDGATRIATARGALRVMATAATRVFECGESDTPAIALCLPEGASSLSRRGTITEIGSDRDALQERDRAGVLFDLGLANPFFDFLIRTADPEQVDFLRRNTGMPLLEADGELAAVLAAMSPHRVFVSALGRIEVYQRIAGPTEKTLEGPHTHLLPALLGGGRIHDQGACIPGGWVPCAMLYPAHPPPDGGHGAAGVH